MTYYFFGADAYIKIYVLLTVGYLWYRFGLLFLDDVMRKREISTPYRNQLLSVIIPYFNENPAILKRTIASVLAARGNKQVIVVDDGSPDKSCAKMIAQRFGSQVTFCSYSPNRGKRDAQKEAFRYVTGEYVITVDSDTVIDENALVELIAPFSDPKVGATTGNVKVLNHDTNLLTKMIAARYWNAFNIERRSLSTVGVVTCCSGVLSAYPASLFARLLDRYTSQQFLGLKCTFGDDRHLTNLVLREGLKIRYVPTAVCHTQVPTRFRAFVKQQLRWKKSFLRESFISLSFAYKRSFVLVAEVLFNLLIPLLSLPLRISLLIALILEPSLIPWYVITIVTVAVIRNFFLFFEDKEMMAHSIIYAFIHELAIYWLYIVALFTIRSKGWGTR